MQNLMAFLFFRSQIMKQLSLVGSTVSFLINDISDHEKTIKQCKNILKKYFSKKKRMKFIVVSGIFSERHSDAIQIINF